MLTDEEVVESFKQDVMIHFSGPNKLHGNAFKTYLLFVKYLHVSGKRDSKCAIIANAKRIR